MTAPGLWVSIDPGDSHVGFAVWNGPRCVRAVEMDPNGVVLELEAMVKGDLALIVCEKFQLYGFAAQQQAGSDFKTPQLIGVIKYIGRRNNVPVVMQMPSFGNAKAMLKVNEIKEKGPRWWTSYGHGGHAKDAEAHGVAWLRRVDRKRAGWE